MRRPAIFFDRDNTLIVGNDYLGDPAKVVLMPGAANTIARCRELGFAIVIVSNQSGVARGMFTEDDVRAVNRKMDQMLLAENQHAVIDRHEYCPFHPDAKVEKYKQDSFLRKPKPGMILAAADAMALDLARSWVVGDAPRDIAAGKSAGCRTILLKPQGIAPSPAALEAADVQPDNTVTTLTEAGNIIARQASAAAPVEAPALKESPSLPTKIEPTPPSTPSPSGVKSDLLKLEQLSQQIVLELRRLHDHKTHDEFSSSKLMAGITQMLAVACVILAYFLYRTDIQILQNWLLVAVFLQTFTVALLIMGKQK